MTSYSLIMSTYTYHELTSSFGVSCSMTTICRMDYIALATVPCTEFPRLVHVHLCPDATAPSFPFGPLLREVGVCDEPIPLCCAFCGRITEQSCRRTYRVADTGADWNDFRDEVCHHKDIAVLVESTAMRPAISTSSLHSSKNTTKRCSTRFGRAGYPCSISGDRSRLFRVGHHDLLVNFYAVCHTWHHKFRTLCHPTMHCLLPLYRLSWNIGKVLPKTTSHQRARSRFLLGCTTALMFGRV